MYADLRPVGNLPEDSRRRRIKLQISGVRFLGGAKNNIDSEQLTFGIDLSCDFWHFFITLS